MASFVRQLSLRLGSVPQEFIDLYQKHKQQSTKPLLDEYVTLFRNVCARFSKVRLLVDALDELDPKIRDDLMDVIEALMDCASILITSRSQSVDSARIEENTLRCTISAHRVDLDAVITDRLGKAAIATRRLREHPCWEGFVYEASEQLIQKADGMFILVALQLELLLRPRTLIEMRKVLETVPQKLHDFYSVTLDRIRARESDLALNVLAWLMEQMRPMKMAELREALAVDYSTTSIDPEALVHADDIVEMCCGLVKFDADDTILLAHATVHEFLAENLSTLDDFDSSITRICLQYLNFAEFTTQTHDWHAPILSGSLPVIERMYDDYNDRIYNHPFLAYAGKYWCEHYKRATEPEELVTPIMTLLEGPNVAAMLQAFSDNKSIGFDGFPSLHTAVRHILASFLPR